MTTNKDGPKNRARGPAEGVSIGHSGQALPEGRRRSSPAKTHKATRQNKRQKKKSRTRRSRAEPARTENISPENISPENISPENVSLENIGAENVSGKTVITDSKVSKTERLLNLIAFLLRSPQPVSVDRILSQVRGYDDQSQKDALMRRFERDKKLLRQLGLPLTFEGDGSVTGGYFIAQDSYFLGEVKLTANSHSLLRALAAALSRRPRSHLTEDLRSALLKLGFDTRSGPDSKTQATLQQQTGSAHAGTAFLDLKVSKQEAQHLEVLSEAVLKRHPIRITYYTISRDQSSERIIHPYGLGFTGQGWHRGAWYMVGDCQSRQAIRVFKVDRIQGQIDVLDQEPSFDIPADFELRSYLSRPRWELSELAQAFQDPIQNQAQNQHPAIQAQVAVDLKQNQAILAQVAVDLKQNQAIQAQVAVDDAIRSELEQLVPSSRVLASSSYAEPDSLTKDGLPKDGLSVLEFSVINRRSFLRFLLRYSGRMRLLGPASLKQELLELATTLQQRYRPSAKKSRPAQAGADGSE